MNKGVEQFDDLHKIPDVIIVKSQQVEIGKLKAYIEELEFNLLKYTNNTSESKIINYKELILNNQNALTNRNQRIVFLESEIDKKNSIINDLMYKNYNKIKHFNHGT